MILLAFDTAGPNCAAAVAQRNDSGFAVLARRDERIGTGHAERLMPMIGEVLADASLSYADLERIAVATGPGSFTGVRIGVAAARGLALALDVPAIGIGVLEAMAFEARPPRDTSTIGVCLDAKRGEIYGFISGADQGSSDTFRSDAGQFARRLAETSERAIILAGSAAAAVAADESLRGRKIALTSQADHADIETIAELGSLAEAAGKPSPLYLRPADAKPQAGKAVARI